MIFPKHVALIPDWNRSWAKDNWLPQIIWHTEWFARWQEIASYIFSETPIDVFTWWGLSTENLLNRSEEELDYLFGMYKEFSKNLEKVMLKNSVNFKWVWNRSWLPQNLVDFLISQENKFKFDSKKYMIIAVNYGWRDEVIRWVKWLVNDVVNWKFDINELTEDKFWNYLDFWDVPQIELVIRTKWDITKRLSWFMLWRIGYAQLYYTDLKCPEFNVDRFKEALIWFDQMSENRNFGK